MSAGETVPGNTFDDGHGGPVAVKKCFKCEHHGRAANGYNSNINGVLKFFFGNIPGNHDNIRREQKRGRTKKCNPLHYCNQPC